MTSKTNIFEQAAQLISLDCSSITGQNITVCPNITRSLNQSLLNLKTVLPTFTSQFSIFKQQILQMTYFIVNKLMGTIKIKNHSITKLQEQLIKSQGLTNQMKQQVIQLKQMITQFMQSYSKQIQIKQKEINQKENQINQLKLIVQQNFKSPRNICDKCQNNIFQIKPITNQQSLKIQNFNKIQTTNFKLNNFIKSYQQNNDLNLIQMSQSLVFNNQINTQKKSLQIIQQQTSQVTSMTDNIQSQRGINNINKYSPFQQKQISQRQKSTRSGILNQKQILSLQNLYQKRSQYQIKSMNSQARTKLIGKQQFDYQKTIKDSNSPTIGKINIMFSGEERYRDNFSSRITKKEDSSQQYNKFQNVRRNSQLNINNNKSLYQGYKIQSKSIQKKNLTSQNYQNPNNYDQFIQRLPLQPSNKFKQNINIKFINQNISKSSSTSQLMHYGDSKQININLPKKLQSPKNINSIRKINQKSNFTKQERDFSQYCSYNKAQRIKTQPSPRDDDNFQLNKQNVKIGYYMKPIEMGKKIFTKKKTIMSHAKTTNTSRVQPKKMIQIKYTLSPQKLQTKSSHILKPENITSLDVSLQNSKIYPDRNNFLYASTNSNISNINSSAVKSHHQYHSTGKYTSPKNNKNSSLKTSCQKVYDRKSLSKSKQKLKVTSKNISHQSTVENQQKFINQMNSCFYNTKSTSKVNKKMYVNLGATRIHLKNNLKQIKLALKTYQFQSFLLKLQEVYFDGKYLNGLKEGFGKIIYDNGIIYEGYIKKGKKQGNGKLVWNGVDLYDGQFVNDCISGQGYLKSLRLIVQSGQCSKILQDSSYFGKFSQNKFDGMGTLFLNQRQKIVTKFKNGIPFGQLTFYTQSDIQFGHWPTQ